MRQIYAVMSLFFAIRFDSIVDAAGAGAAAVVPCCVLQLNTLLYMFCCHHFPSTQARCLLCSALDFNLHYGFALSDDNINTNTPCNAHNKNNVDVFDQSMYFINYSHYHWWNFPMQSQCVGCCCLTVTSKWNSIQMDWYWIRVFCSPLTLSRCVLSYCFPITRTMKSMYIYIVYVCMHRCEQTNDDVIQPIHTCRQYDINFGLLIYNVWKFISKFSDETILEQTLHWRLLVFAFSSVTNWIFKTNHHQSWYLLSWFVADDDGDGNDDDDVVAIQYNNMTESSKLSLIYMYMKCYKYSRFMQSNTVTYVTFIDGMKIKPSKFVIKWSTKQFWC